MTGPILVTLLLTPLMLVLRAVVYAAMLCVPVMLLLNQIHEFFAFIPPLGWWEVALCLALLSFFLPSYNTDT